MLTWDDLDVSVNAGGDGRGEPRERKRKRPTAPRRKKVKVVKKQENRITKTTPIPQTKTKKSTLPDDKVIGENKGAMSVMPLMEDESGADGEKSNKETIVLPNLMKPSPERVKVVEPTDWTFPLYKDKYVILTVIGVTIGIMIAKKYNKNLLLSGMLGAATGVVLANAEVRLNKKETTNQIEQ